ncbi:serine/threonine-protein kinase [Streptomyces pratens]|uniref:Serine/threonine-protein kinase n=1 Tax=Streptomyces pratens TaxID=887456 RepID=A0ABW1M1J9_9ACTN
MQITPLNPEDPVVLGDFELLGRIGHGGMGQVFLGESLGGEPAAVKVIKPSVVDSESRQRFAQEVEALKTIWGARISAFLGADAEAEQPWLATEYVDGPDLARHVRTHGPLPSVLTAALGAILAEALSGVHAQGLLHRDLKPANVLLGPNGPKIIDFGLAAFTESTISLTALHQVVGTPICMAPEQAAGVKPLTAAVDVYALGALLLFSVTGHYPHEAATPYMVFHLVTDPGTAPDLSGVPEELLPLLTGMLAQDAGDRPSLTGVVQQCRAVIEAQGMRSRRRAAGSPRTPQSSVGTGRRRPPTVSPPWPGPPPRVTPGSRRSARPSWRHRPTPRRSPPPSPKPSSRGRPPPRRPTPRPPPTLRSPTPPPPCPPNRATAPAVPGASSRSRGTARPWIPDGPRSRRTRCATPSRPAGRRSGCVPRTRRRPRSDTDGRSAGPRARSPVTRPAGPAVPHRSPAPPDIQPDDMIAQEAPA